MDAKLSIHPTDSVDPAMERTRWHPAVRAAWLSLIGVSAMVVVGVLVWQGITAHGTPDPTSDNVSRSAAIVDTGVLVFREGLEAILVLAALTASLVRTEEGYWKPVAIGG